MPNVAEDLVFVNGRCAHCGRSGEVCKEHGYWMCLECLNRRTVVCCDCGRREDSAYAYWTRDDKRICASCSLSDRWVQCRECGYFVRSGESTMATCGPGSQPEPVCSMCAQHFFTCAACGNLVSERYRCCGRYCTACCPGDVPGYTCRQNVQLGLMGWEYKPRMKFYGHGDVFYGIELETDQYGDYYDGIAALDRINKERRFYLKEDGSLNDGFEVVWMPHSFDEWTSGRTQLDEVCAVVKRKGGRSFKTRTCGLHVHRSRTDLTDMTISKLITLMVKFKNEIIKLAQRHCPHYASFEAIENDVTYNPTLVYKKCKDGDYRENRYVALNLSNKNTIEFRVFKGTLKPETILNYIAFCDALVSWAKTINTIQSIRTSGDKLWEQFTKYCRKHYHPLYDYLASKELCDVRPQVDLLDFKQYKLAG